MYASGTGPIINDLGSQVVTVEQAVDTRRQSVRTFVAVLNSCHHKIGILLDSLMTVTDIRIKFLVIYAGRLIDAYSRESACFYLKHQPVYDIR